MIRPIVSWQNEDWFVEYDNEMLVNIANITIQKSFGAMTRSEIEELSDACLIREQEYTELIACLDSHLDIMDYNKGYEAPTPQPVWNTKSELSDEC